MDKELANQKSLSAFEELLPILGEDTKEAIESANNEKNSRNYRNAYRTAFAEIEGLIFAMRQLVLRDTAGSRMKYSNAEIALLKEEAYQINSRGEAETVSKYLRIQDNLLFTVKMLSKSANYEPEIDLSGHGWEDFLMSIKVRNRITHPRFSKEMTITDSEYE